MRYNPDEDRRFTLRLDDDLRETLTAEARRQMRSLCSEIKFRLRQTLERRQPELRGREQASAS
jgi:predicted HicB family RNase H-like nuclease